MQDSYDIRTQRGIETGELPPSLTKWSQSNPDSKCEVGVLDIDDLRRPVSPRSVICMIDTKGHENVREIGFDVLSLGEVVVLTGGSILLDSIQQIVSHHEDGMRSHQVRGDLLKMLETHLGEEPDNNVPVIAACRS